MNDMEKSVLGIVNTIYEAMQFLLETNLEQQVTLLDDICSALEDLGQWADQNEKLKDTELAEVQNFTVALRQLKDLRNFNKYSKLANEIDQWMTDLLRGLFSYRPNNEDDVIIINTDNVAAPTEGNDLFESRNNVMNGNNDLANPLITVIIIAYNRLDKTKRCVESFLKYSANVKNRLILLDNGSSDGTFEYFKTVPHYDKTIIRVTKNIGAGLRNVSAIAKIKTKYMCSIANDVILTPNFLENMLTCAMSDPRIGMVVPCSSNISNFQDPGLVFDNLYELASVAGQYNISNPRKWHERLRLMTVVQMIKVECSDITGGADYGFFHDFKDDDLSFRVRRSGYKTVLCMDTYVHHDHDVFSNGGKDPEKYRKSLEKGRSNFIEKHFGLDAWSDVNNYERDLINFIHPHPGQAAAHLLGVDVRCGTPLLEMKNRLKGYGIFDTSLASFSQQAKYYVDLSTICDGGVVCDREEYFSDYYSENFFDWIIFGKSLGTYRDPFKMLKKALMAVKPGGGILLKIFDERIVKEISSKFYKNDLEKEISRIFFSFQKLERELSHQTFEIVSHLTNVQEIEPEIVCQLEKLLDKIKHKGRNLNLKNPGEKITTARYHMIQIKKKA